MKNATPANWLEKTIGIIFAITLLSALAVVFFFPINYHYNEHQVYQTPYWNNFICAAVGVVALFTLYQICKRIPSGRRTFCFIAIMSVSFAIVQFIAIKQYYFQMTWDPDIVYRSAQGLALGGAMPDENAVRRNYLQIYPNNRLITILYALIIKLATMANMDAYLWLIAINCAVCCVVSILIYLIALKLVNVGAAVLSWLMSTVLIGMSPWISVPYSDVIGLLFPVSIVFLYCCKMSNHRLEMAKWVLMGCICAVGFMIKPQTIIIFISLVLYEGVKMVFVKDEMRWRNRALVSCTVLASTMLTYAILSSVCNVVIRTDKSKEVSITHYLMMGMNWESRGEYSHSDLLNTVANGKNSREKMKYNLAIIEQRLRQMGLSGLAKLIWTKQYANYHDGLFAWGEEQPFFRYADKHSMNFFKNVYYTQNIGRYSRAMQTSMQCIWLGVLCFAVFAVFEKSRNRRVLMVMMLGIIGLTLFQLIFEARSRYLFTYLPIYIIMASAGVYGLSGRVGKFSNDIINSKSLYGYLFK